MNGAHFATKPLFGEKNNVSHRTNFSPKNPTFSVNGLGSRPKVGFSDAFPVL